jgi:MFS family permease
MHPAYRKRATPLISEPTPDPAPVESGDARWKRTFTALENPNYRLWFYGQMVSLFGTWMQTTAQGFLVFELTHSSTYLGIVGFAAGVPTWLLTLYGGVVADRISRRTLMIVTQTVMMILALLLAALTFLNLVQPWHIVGLALLLGIANSFDAPARQAFVSELVPRHHMTNAIALNATMFNTATALGPAIAGITYALFGPAWCFTINGLSFIAVIIALKLMKLAPPQPRVHGSSVWSELKEGIAYVLSEPVIRTIFALVAATSMFAISMATLIPAWSVNILKGHAATNGFLLSARGFGSLVGSLFIASLGNTRYRGRFLTAGSIAYPLLIAAFAIAEWTPLSALLLAGIGLGTILVLNLANAIVQTSTPDRLRGRVMGAYTWIFFGFMPVGALWIGTTAEHFGEPPAVIANALAALAIALIVFFLVPRLRQR